MQNEEEKYGCGTRYLTRKKIGGGSVVVLSNGRQAVWLFRQLLREGWRSSFFMFQSFLAMDQEYHIEVVGSEWWYKASESAPWREQCLKMSLL